MRLLYTVQRYGEEVVGGSETACRAFAEHLAARGHQVEVITSCAVEYATWADHYAPGRHELNGVVVHRLPVRAPRTSEAFLPLNEWIVPGRRPQPLALQQRWARIGGPDLDGYEPWLWRNASRFDAAVHMTYLYTTTTLGLPVLSGLVPTLLQPTAHDEPTIRPALFDTMFRLPDALLFFTIEEREYVSQRFWIEPEGPVLGIGINVDEVEAGASAVAEFRRRHGLGDGPYLLYAGRADPVKGTHELIRFFAAAKERQPGPLRLVIAGERGVSLPEHPDVIVTGFLSENDKHAAMAGALALVQPSYFESFSIVLCEAWAQRRPALVQGACEVLAGQARRSGGAYAYRGFAQFEAAVETLVARPDLADAMGQAGHRYVRANYAWDVVLGRFEAAIELARRRFAERSQTVATMPRSPGPSIATSRRVNA